MKKTIVILAVIFTALSIVFSVLPLDTLAFLPIGLALAFSLLALKNATETKKKFPKILLIIGVVCSVYVLGKTILIKDEVANDTQFEQQKIETKQEAKKELEELEGLE